MEGFKYIIIGEDEIDTIKFNKEFLWISIWDNYINWIIEEIWKWYKLSLCFHDVDWLELWDKRYIHINNNHVDVIKDFLNKYSSIHTIYIQCFAWISRSSWLALWLWWLNNKKKIISKEEIIEKWSKWLLKIWVDNNILIHEKHYPNSYVFWKIINM